MDPRLSEITETLAEDTSSGASEMHASILNSLLSLSEQDLSAIPASDWEDFSIGIYKARPSIAPVFNIANTIMLMMEQGNKGAGSLRQTLMESMEKKRRLGSLACLAHPRAVVRPPRTLNVAQVLRACRTGD